MILAMGSHIHAFISPHIQPWIELLLSLPVVLWAGYPILQRCWVSYKTGEIFTPSFWKAVFIKSFVNKRYQREGDIHVWKDDHIDWEKIKQICLESNASIVEEVDYLLYKQKGGLDLFNQYKDHCSDTKFMIIRK